MVVVVRRLLILLSFLLIVRGRESLKIPLLLAVQMPRQFHFLPMSLNVHHFVRLLGNTLNEGSRGYESAAI